MKLKFQYFLIGINVVLLVLFASLVSASILISMNALPTACHQPKMPGLCRGKFLRYYYNKDTGHCISFYYTGCLGSQNNFLTYEECRRECMNTQRRY